MPKIYSTLLSQNLHYRYGAELLSTLRACRERVGQFNTFECLLVIHQGCEASDSRDMIFAVQNIARQGFKPFDTHGHLMVPDYTVKVQTLYTRTTRIMIQCYDDLRFLAHRELRKHKGVGSLPSWVPDYSVPLTPSPFIRRGPNCNWCAAASVGMQSNIRSYEVILLDVKGCFIGSIEARSDDPTNNTDWSGLWKSVCEVASGVAPYYSLDQRAEL